MTLSTGSLTFAAWSLGLESIYTPAFQAAVVGILVILALNLMVSFAFAFAVASARARCPSHRAVA